MGTTFDEIIDILDKWQFMLGQRAGRELWLDKPTEVQNEDLANFNRDLEKVRSFINLLRAGGLSSRKNACGLCECLIDIDKSQGGGVCTLDGEFHKFHNVCDKETN